MHKRQREARRHRLRFDKAKRRHAIVQSVCDAMLRVVASAFAFESARIKRQLDELTLDAFRRNYKALAIEARRALAEGQKDTNTPEA